MLSIRGRLDAVVIFPQRVVTATLMAEPGMAIRLREATRTYGAMDGDKKGSRANSPMTARKMKRAQLAVATTLRRRWMKDPTGSTTRMVTKAGSDVYSPTSQLGEPSLIRNTEMKDMAPAPEMAWKMTSA